MRHGLRAPALRIGEAKHLRFHVIVRPCRSQKLKKPLTSQQRRAANGVGHLKPDRRQVAPKMRKLVVAEYAVASRLELLDARKQRDGIARQLEHGSIKS